MLEAELQPTAPPGAGRGYASGLSQSEPSPQSPRAASDFAHQGARPRHLEACSQKEDPFGHLASEFDDDAPPKAPRQPVPIPPEGSGLQTAEVSPEEDPLGHLAVGLDDAEPAPALAASAEPSGGNEGGEEQPSQCGGARPSHSLGRVAHIVWCTVYERHAAKRLGSGLLGSCRGEATGAYPRRIARLRARRHPLIGVPV